MAEQAGIELAGTCRFCGLFIFARDWGSGPWDAAGPDRAGVVCEGNEGGWHEPGGGHA